MEVMCMKIVIKNEKDLKRFYHKLFIYRSYFFSFVKFKSDNKEIEKIINALNIKRKSKRNAYIFDEVCKEIDDYFKGENICGFDDKGYCMAGLKNGCCRVCKYVGSKGCPSHNVACKLYFCHLVYEKREVPTYKDFKLLKVMGIRKRAITIHNYFVVRDVALRDINFPIMTLTTIWMFIRMLKDNFSKLIKKD